MEVTPPRLDPVDELDAEFVRAPGATNELELVEPQDLVEFLDGRDRRFADSDDADLLGLDECDPAGRTQRVGQRGGRHPSGRTASGDDDAGQLAVFGTHR